MANKRISELDNLASGDVDDAQLVEVADATAETNYKFTWANIKVALKTYFDTLYTAVATYTSHVADFNNHKARHQDGGADEISIAGLAGESAELTTHKAVQTSVHGSTDAATASKIVQRDANGRAKVADGSDAADIATKGQMDTALGFKAADADVIKKAGTVAFTGDQSMGGFKLTNLAAPVADSDAARKHDVDAAGGIDLLATSQQDTPDLTIQVSAGNVWFGGTLVEFAGDDSPEFTAPAANPRIDVLSLSSAGALVRTEGTEAGSPTMPAVPAGNIPICSVYNRVGQTSVKDADDSSNGYVLADLRPLMPFYGDVVDFTASDTLVHSNDDVKSMIVETYTKLKEVLLNQDIPACRIKFDIQEAAGGTAYGKIYKNGVAIGTEQSKLGSGYATKTEDFTDFESGDLIQIYGKAQAGGYTVYLKNFRFYWDNTITHIATRELETPLAIVEISNITNQDP